MKVILDTNIIVRDWYLESGPMRRFDTLRTEHQVDVFIPKVVCIEIIDKFKEKVSEVGKIQFKVAKDLMQLTATSQSAHELVDVEIEVQKYKDWLDRKLLDDWSATIIPIPTISHEKTIERLQSRKKPFDKHTKFKEVGYKDYLIWESILSVLGDDTEQLFFITDNSKDFFMEGVLHCDLLADISAGQVIIPFSDVHSFVDSQLLPITAEADVILKSLISGSFGQIDWHKWVEENFLTHFDSDDLTDFFTHDGDDDLRRVSNVQLQNIQALDFTRVGILSENRVAINFCVELLVNYDLEISPDIKDESQDYSWVSPDELSVKNEILKIGFSCSTNSDRTDISDSYYVHVDTNYVSVSTPFGDNRIYYQDVLADVTKPNSASE